LMAFEIETGKTLWTWNGDGPSYASPIAITLAGTRQIVTQTQKYLIGLSATDGKLLWSLPFATAYVQNIITPILYKDTLVYSGLDKGITAIRLKQSGGVWQTETVWENPGVAFYMSNPVVNGGILFGMSHKNKGQFAAVDLATGKTLWMTTGREGDNAALATAGDKVFMLTTDADLIVSKANSTALETVRRYTVAKSPVWAQPVFTGKGVLIKDLETLTLWGWE
jgi:outer membrane protein assembly factor BamB